MEPARLEVARRRGGTERTRAPVREHVEHLAEPRAVLRELVDPRRRRWVELAAADDAALLERLQPRSEDVGAAAGKPRMEIRVAKLVVFEQLADDQQRPALTDEVERMRHRAVLVVALGHVFDTSRSSFKTEVLTCKLKVSVVGSLTRLTRETTEGALHGHYAIARSGSHSRSSSRCSSWSSSTSRS